jgi:hypothetical protein
MRASSRSDVRDGRFATRIDFKTIVARKASSAPNEKGEISVVGWDHAE